eukprot:588472-Amphidinium_carterae.1
MPDGSAATKELPATHRDLRAAESAAPTRDPLSDQEAAAFEKWWQGLPSGAEVQAAVVVANFLNTSGLRKEVLKQIWAVANPGLVAHCQSLGEACKEVAEAGRPLRVKLRTECVERASPQLPSFNVNGAFIDLCLKGSFQMTLGRHWGEDVLKRIPVCQPRPIGRAASASGRVCSVDCPCWQSRY